MMTCEEIFTKLINHMVEGIMTHEELANYYQFLSLPYYSKCHEKHYYQENKSYRKIYNYYIRTYNKMLKNIKVDVPQVIPESWYQYTRYDVDIKTKQTAVQQGLDKWLKWETVTYELYQELYQELIQLNKIKDAEMIRDLIDDVKEELDNINQYKLNKMSTDYDMVYIIEENQSKDKII